jgi:hypothetical protein
MVISSFHTDISIPGSWIRLSGFPRLLADDSALVHAEPDALPAAILQPCADIQLQGR